MSPVTFEDMSRHVATFGDICLICLLKSEDIRHVLKICRDMSKTYPTKDAAYADLPAMIGQYDQDPESDSESEDKDEDDPLNLPSSSFG